MLEPLAAAIALIGLVALVLRSDATARGRALALGALVVAGLAV